MMNNEPGMLKLNSHHFDIRNSLLNILRFQRPKPLPASKPLSPTATPAQPANLASTSLRP